MSSAFRKSKSMREWKGEVTGGIEERMLIFGLGSVEYTVEYVSSAGLYSATGEVGQVITSFSEGVVDDY
jgi:hypothetical protein